MNYPYAGKTQAMRTLYHNPVFDITWFRELARENGLPHRLSITLE